MSITLPSRTPLSRPGEPAARQDLGRLYRAIGIGAVAAALPYRGDVKNSAYAPTRPRTAKPLAADDRMR